MAVMEQLHNQTIETENTITRPRLRWIDFVVIMLALAVMVASFALPKFAVEQPKELVVVTRFVCQPTPTAGTGYGGWRP